MRKNTIINYAFICFILLNSYICHGCSVTATIPLIESEKDKLIYDLLVLSLSKTDVNVCLTQLEQVITDARKTRRVEEGSLSLKWSSASNPLEKNLKPIKVPIFKGLLGYRIFVIRKGDQNRFNSIKTLEDLRKLTAGQGYFWGDTKILQTAGIPVVTAAQGRNLWSMLASHRFDYMPLAVHEPWLDLEHRAELQLEVEKNLLLVYPSAMFFYVSTENKVLYDLISSGMERAINDGSYDRLFYQSRMIQAVVERVNLSTRKVIYIYNPLIDTNLLPTNPKYWFPLPSLM
ncbi:diguanylate cyclase [Cellvibrio sp. KY-GH-1]|uniref:amino acid ABC transporter substrate-binding protein n=1 Tax=Cellvibrio sp. KY-GH-1 TaxID=2303332 RepID=UPI001247EC11|nr:amino acid ABC transporter substrate-binding protein [Cellvibrio sp. KY-GH-1]QEY14893.1 diguanylate cyclase [Cellvibrio sp. KY-GH-1]